MSQIQPLDSVSVPAPTVEVARVGGPDRERAGRRRLRLPGWLKLLLGNPKSRGGIIVLSGIILLALIAPWIAHGNPNDFSLIDSRQSPSFHHLFGTTLLHRHGIEVVIPTYRKYRWLAGLGRRARLGDLDQQFRALFQDCDIVYSASQNVTLALAVLRAAGLFRRPIVATVHGPFRPGVESWIARGPYSMGHDKLVCMGPGVERHLREDIGVPPGKLEILPWGVDLDFYRRDLVVPPPDGPPLVVSAGKVARDYGTLIRAVEGLPCRLVLVTSGYDPPPSGPLPANVDVVAGHGEDVALSFTELLSLYQRCRLVAVPLRQARNARGQTGNTSLLEAMAMARPVIMTRTDRLAFDLEGEGVGLWVEPGDVAGWRRALTRLLDDPATTRNMGERGRALCEERYNMEVFSTRLAAILAQTLEGCRGRFSIRESPVHGS